MTGLVLRCGVGSERQIPLVVHSLDPFHLDLTAADLPLDRPAPTLFLLSRLSCKKETHRKQWRDQLEAKVPIGTLYKARVCVENNLAAGFRILMLSEPVQVSAVQNKPAASPIRGSTSLSDGSLQQRSLH